MRAVARLALGALLAAAAIPAWGRSPGQSALDEGVARYRQGRYEEALASFRKAVDLDPSLTKAWENIGWAQHRLGDDKEALRVWTTVLKLEPGNVDAWNAVGEVQYASGAWAACATAFERSLGLRPEQRDQRLRLGQAYEKLGRLDAAAEQYRAMLAGRPGDVKATQRLSDLEESRGRLDDAVALLRRGIASGTDSGGQLGKRLARVLAKQGDEAFRAGDFPTAAAFYREASEHDPERTLYLVNLGWAERRAGAADRAVAAWRGALERGVPSPADLWRAIGDACREAGRHDDARDAYGRSAQADPRAGAALYSLAAIALDGGDVAGAVRSLRQMFAVADLGEEDATRAANLFIAAGAIDAGESLFDDLAEDSARATIARIALARLHAARASAAYRAGDDAVASAFYRKALEADPHNRAALRDAGWALWRQGDWAGVRRVWSAYVAAYPGLPEPHELLGRLELQHGAPREAIDQARQALAVGGDAKAANVLLTKALLADGRFHSARDLAARLATEYPDDLPVQTLYGEALWRSLDYPAAKDQWRKVLDMGSDSPRAMHYWLRSTYETGAYDDAIAAAEAAFSAGRASEPVLRLLAEDARVRADDAVTIRWYRELTARYPQRVGYWTALAEVYDDREAWREETAVLEQALVRQPDSPELKLLLAEAHLASGHPRRALQEFRVLRGALGRNRTAFAGEVRSLNALGRHDEALALLRSEGADYLDADERALEEASSFEDMGRRAEAADRRRRVIAPPAGTVDLPILLYHGIADHPRTLSVPVDRFASEMQAIHDAGFTSITVTELDAMLAGRALFPARPIIVTFDDARSDSFRYADPVLERLGMKATMFVPTVRIAEESAFNADWPTLARLRATGRWDFQAHGHLAHDPIAIDGEGGMAEFLVNRQWLADEGRLETHDEFVQRVEADYAACSSRLSDNLPGQRVVGFAFPFSEMGQLHGGNDPAALAVNEAAFRRLYRYGFVQDATGYNAVAPGAAGPMLLHRFSVPREWDGPRLLAHLAAKAPPERARLDAARADLWNARYRRAEATLRDMTASDPRTYSEAGAVLALALHEQDREREAARAYALVPAGPAWGRPDVFQRRLARELAWETDPQAGADTRLASDSDGRDAFEAVATGRVPFAAPVNVWAEAGAIQLRDADFPSLSGPEGTVGVEWVGAKRVALGGWLRGRSLGSGVDTVEGEATLRGRVDGHRFGAACGVTDVETVGALREGIAQRGCEASYEALGRVWRTRVRASYRDLTDGNTVAYAWADGTVGLGPKRLVAVGGRLEAGDSRFDAPLYYAPSGLVTALGIVRYARTFPSGANLDAEVGAGPSRDDRAGSRLVGRVRGNWTQDWSDRWRTTLTAEYGETPDYRRVGLAFSFGYRF